MANRDRCDWSSDVCSSDLQERDRVFREGLGHFAGMKVHARVRFESLSDRFGKSFAVDAKRFAGRDRVIVGQAKKE
jgi:hypothetical protein